MSIIPKIVSGYLAGFSVGFYCLGLCLPVFLPILLSKKRDIKKSFRLVIEFSLGRLFGYLFFGLIFGWLGQTIKSSLAHQIVSLANLWLGISIIIYSLGTINQKFCPTKLFNKKKPSPPLKSGKVSFGAGLLRLRQSCVRQIGVLATGEIRWAFLVGFLTGVNICPPFLASLTYVFNLRDVFLSLIYFFAFFLGTSTYIVPAAIFGIFTRFPWLQKLGQVSGFLVGFYFIAQSLFKII